MNPKHSEFGVMKTNGAPEKIYMTPSFGEPDNVLLASFSKSHLDYHRDIEYTRTDTFIEKAAKWLMDNIQNYTDDGMGEHSFVLVQDLKEDFKKYMGV